MVDSYIDALNNWRPMTDGETASFAFITDDSPGPIKVVNNYISAIGISFQTTNNGADAWPPASPWMPKSVKITSIKIHFIGPAGPNSDGNNYFNRHHFRDKSAVSAF